MFQISALSMTEFHQLCALPDEALRARGMKRYVADHTPGFPCRVSLRDAEPGERVILLTYEHHPVASPYRSSGPIFVREDAEESTPARGEVPELLRLRTLSLRAYTAAAMMIDAAIVEGPALESGIAHLFENPRVAYLHVHYAPTGCYACRVDRVR